MKVMIDTNILLDVMFNRADFVEASSKIWKLSEIKKIHGYICALSIPNIVYVLRKELTPEKVQTIVNQISLIFEIVDLKASDLKLAADMKLSDYEDAIQIACAYRLKADLIVTRNIRDFSESKIPVLNPDELLEKIRNVETL
ncbi:MAG: PIN domain-containing protein [Ruminococcus sp.]|nr:PIN domain-containing protein [Ruminococcus sp.]